MAVEAPDIDAPLPPGISPSRSDALKRPVQLTMRSNRRATHVLQEGRWSVDQQEPLWFAKNVEFPA